MRSRTEWLRVFGRAARTPLGLTGLIITAVVLAVAVVGPFVTPYPQTLTVTAPFASPTVEHVLGGDVLGRDVLSRVFAGGWLLLIVSLVATFLGVGAGIVLGLVSAYRGGWRDGVIMRVVDIVLAFPALVFAMLMVSVVGPQLWLLVLAVAVAHAPQVARVVRSAALDVTERDFVHAVRMVGMRPVKVMAKEILPNISTVVLVEFGLRFTFSILIIASLSFLGIGLQPPNANWGLMLNENRLGLPINPWAMVVPILLIALLTVGLNMYTEAVSAAARGARSADSEEEAAVETVVTETAEARV